MFLVPTKLVPTALTRLFSLRTKMRMALELLHPPRPSEHDESVAALVERHFGARPSTASPIRCSAASMAATPRSSARAPCCRAWWRWRRKYGSLTRGMLAAHQQDAAAMAKNSVQQRQTASSAGHLHRPARRHAANG